MVLISGVSCPESIYCARVINIKYLPLNNIKSILFIQKNTSIQLTRSDSRVSNTTNCILCFLCYFDKLLGFLPLNQITFNPR